MVWDLQHRPPTFVSRNQREGTWDRREAFYTWFLGRAAFVIAGPKPAAEIERFFRVPSERIKIYAPTPHTRCKRQLERSRLLVKYGLTVDTYFTGSILAA